MWRRSRVRSIEAVLWSYVGAGVSVAVIGLVLNLGEMLVTGLVIGTVAIVVLVAMRLRVPLGAIQYSLRDRSTRVPIQPVSAVDPTSIGVDPATQDVLPGGEMPLYLPREVDEELQTAVRAALHGRGPWIVVAVGSSKTGKSRTLFEALRHCAEEAEIELVAPVDGKALRSLAEEPGAGGKRKVLWLDDLEPFLSEGVTLQTLREWHQSSGKGVVAATYGGRGSDLVRASAPGALATIAAEVLEHAHETHVGITTPSELERLRPLLPAEDFSSVGEHGFAAYLVAAPHLVRKLTSARHSPGEPECPEGAAVTYAAIDWVRCGRRDPIPEETLRELWPSYLSAGVRPSKTAFETGLAWALSSVAGTIALLLRHSGGYRPYEYAVQLVDSTATSSPPHDATWARAVAGATGAQALEVGVSAYVHGSLRNALTAFQVAAASSAAEVAAVASFNVGITLAALDRTEEAIDVYDQVVRNFGEDPDLLEQAASAMTHKGLALGKLNRREEAIAVYDEVVQRFGDSAELGLCEQVARTLVSKGILLSEGDDHERAIAVFDDVRRRFGDAGAPVLREQAAAALVNKGMALTELDRFEEAIAVYEEVAARYGADPEPWLLPIVAQALGNKGVALAALGRQEDAIAVYRDVVDRYDEAPDLALRQVAARARYSIGLTLATVGREREAIAVFDDLVARYGEAPDPELRELAKRAQTGKGLARGTLKRSEDIRAGDQEALGRAKVGEEESLQAEFERNLREPVRLTSVHLTGLEMYADTSWELHPSMNLLLGRNGYGKSLLLHIVAAMLQREGEIVDGLVEKGRSDGRIELGLLRNGSEERIGRDHAVFLRGSLGEVPLLAIPDARFMDRSTTTVADPGALDLTRKGASHFLDQQPYQAVVEVLLSGLAIDYWVHGATFDLPSFTLINETLEKLTDQSFEFRGIERVGRTGSRILVRTEGVDRDLPIQRASQGTLSVITMFGLVYAFLLAIAEARGADGAKDARNQEAIVLIDEVDAHLHPLWQQRIRNALVEMFPNVQFVLTAHSPLVVAGCGPREVSVMRASENGFALEQTRRDFVGASAQDLYTEVFEVEDFDDTFRRYAELEARGEDEKREQQLEQLIDKDQEPDGLAEDEQRVLRQLLLDKRRMARVEEVQEERQDDEVKAAEMRGRIVRLERELERSRSDGGGKAG